MFSVGFAPNAVMVIVPAPCAVQASFAALAALYCADVIPLPNPIITMLLAVTPVALTVCVGGAALDHEPDASVRLRAIGASALEFKVFLTSST